MTNFLRPATSFGERFADFVRIIGLVSLVVVAIGWGFVEMAVFSLALLGVVRWVPALLVGIAVAWCGFATVARTVGSAMSFLLLWIAPVLLTSISAAAGTRVYARHPTEMLSYGVDVFRSVLGSTEAIVPLLLAAVVTALVMSLRWMSRRRVPTPA